MKLLTEVIDRCIKHKGVSTTVEVLDNIKATGYKYCTLAAISISIADVTIPPEKHSLIAKAKRLLKISSANIIMANSRKKNVMNR